MDQSELMQKVEWGNVQRDIHQCRVKTMEPTLFMFDYELNLHYHFMNEHIE